MVSRVIGPRAFHDPLMDDDKSTRFALWKQGLVPSSHVLVKVVGQTISASWSVTNTGGVTGLGHLDIFFPSTGTGFFGGDVSIPAGGSATLSVAGVISSLVPGIYAGEVEVRASAPATVAPGGKHPFTLTVSGGAAVLTASPAGPTII